MRQLSPRLAQAVGGLVARAIEAREEGSGRPFMIGHFVTNRCMCKCASCLWRHNDWADVPLDDLKRFYAQAAQERFLAAAFSGGEPFLRKDLGELAAFVRREAGMAILLFTTGWFLEERMDEVLPHVDMLMMSLDSARPARHDEIRGLPGLFDRLMRGIDLVKRDFPEVSLQLNVCVQKGTGEEIDDMVALAVEKGVHISFDVITEYRHGRAGAHFTETGMSMPLAELREVSGRLLEKKRQGAPIVNSALYFEYFRDGKPGYRCHLPKLTMCIDGRGFVEDCLDLERPIADIRATPLKEILELPRFKQLRKDAEGCSSCNSPTMVDLSKVWENPALVFEKGGLSLG